MKVYKNRGDPRLKKSLKEAKERKIIESSSRTERGKKIIEMRYLGISGLTVFREWMDRFVKDYKLLVESNKNDYVVNFHVLLLHPFSHPARVRIQAEVEWDRTTCRKEDLRKEWKLAPKVYIRNPQVILANIEGSEVHAKRLQDLYTTIQNVYFLKDIVKEKFKNKDLENTYKELEIDPIEVRFCCLSPMMSMFLINKRMFVEHYHYGKKDKEQQCLGLNTCVFGLDADETEDRETFKYYLNHFRYLWECDSTIHWEDALASSNLLRMPEDLIVDNRLDYIRGKWEASGNNPESFSETIESNLRKAIKGSCIKKEDPSKRYDLDETKHIMDKIKDIIETKHDLQMWFQPICEGASNDNNQTGLSVKGYEALAVIFDDSRLVPITERVFKTIGPDVGLKLDRLCILKAICQYLKESDNILRMVKWFSGKKPTLPHLFINISANTLMKGFPHWFNTTLQEEIKKELKPVKGSNSNKNSPLWKVLKKKLKQHVVFEITEHDVNRLVELKQEELSQLQDFKFALDDIGMKKGNMEEPLRQTRQARIKPQYIKLSLDLFGPNWAYLEELSHHLTDLVRWKDENGMEDSEIVAERIENREEFEAIRNNSAHLHAPIRYYQGYYFGKKAPFFRLPKFREI